MDIKRFDSISRQFAERRLSRRAALQGSAGLTGGILTGSVLAGRHAAAQEATPEHDEGAAESSQFLFVQSFEQGSIAPKEGEDGAFTVTLAHGLGQTIFFSDRPERIVGASPTGEFLQGLGFGADNPPNAALLVNAASDTAVIAVVELTNPVYDESSRTATYDLTALDVYEQALGMSLTDEPADLAMIPAEFGAAHLFIDDCADYGVSCCADYDFASYTCNAPYVYTFPPMGYCYSWAWVHCFPCEPYNHDIPPCKGGCNPVVTYWEQKCNAATNACNGICEPIFWT